MNSPIKEYQASNLVSHEMTTINLPSTFRVIKLKNQHLSQNSYLNSAELYHDQASLKVAWITQELEQNISLGILVTPNWKKQPISTDGYIHINGLSAINRPNLDVNLFETVPYEWIKEREHLKLAKALIACLPGHFAVLFAAIFWDYKRFYRFLVGPSSLHGHHNWKHGNFIHTIEVASNAIKLAEDRPNVCREVLIIAALLHDAAKADEYRQNHQKSCFEISTRGALIGHKMTIIEWIAAAIAQFQITIPTQQYLGLMHALTAVKGCPEWIGLREPASPECHLLSIADRLSGQDDLINQTMPKNGGFGKYHKHLKGRPFIFHAPSS